jgi:hypothetical protein
MWTTPVDNYYASASVRPAASDTPSILGRNDPLNEAFADKAIDEPARVPATCSHQELTDSSQGQLPVIGQDSKNLRLPRVILMTRGSRASRRLPSRSAARMR